MQLITIFLKFVAFALGLKIQGNPEFVLRERCIGTVFGAVGDKHMGTKTACAPYIFDRNVIGIAHRFLPCGKHVLIHIPRTDKWQDAIVIDRGPYGAIMEDGSWGLKIKRDDPGKWRGCVDMTPPLSRALDHSGWDIVEIWY